MPTYILWYVCIFEKYINTFKQLPVMQREWKKGWEMKGDDNFYMRGIFYKPIEMYEKN